MIRARTVANVSRAARRGYATSVPVTPIPKSTTEFAQQRQAVKEHAKGE